MIGETNMICAIDALGSTATTSESSLPVFPEENPTQPVLAAWIEKWDAALGSNGEARLERSSGSRSVNIRNFLKLLAGDPSTTPARSEFTSQLKSTPESTNIMTKHIQRHKTRAHWILDTVHGTNLESLLTIDRRFACGESSLEK